MIGLFNEKFSLLCIDTSSLSFSAVDFHHESESNTVSIQRLHEWKMHARFHRVILPLHFAEPRKKKIYKNWNSRRQHNLFHFGIFCVSTVYSADKSTVSCCSTAAPPLQLAGKSPWSSLELHIWSLTLLLRRAQLTVVSYLFTLQFYRS